MDHLSRKVEVLAGLGQEVMALVNEILLRQNSDGGWGSNKTYVSNTADTSLALKSLSLAGYTDHPVISRAIDYIKAKKNADNGWGSEDEGSTIQATANILSAFK